MASSSPPPPSQSYSSATPSYQFITHLPIAPSSPSEKVEEEEPRVPIHVVTKASQLPVDFLEPSPHSKIVIGFDCEAVDLCRDGALCIIQLAFPDAIYLVDAIEGGSVLIEACKPALESDYVTKVIHDCKRDSIVLSVRHQVKQCGRYPDCLLTSRRARRTKAVAR